MATTDPTPPDLCLVDPGRTAGWRAALEAHLLRLDPEERRTRFLGSVSEAGIRAHVAGADPLLLVVHAPAGVIRGCAEVHQGAAPDEAEVAVSVESGWQNRGLGAALTRRATEAARAAGHGDVRLTCLRRNGPMLRIARQLPAHTLPMADWALTLFQVDTPPPGAP